VLDEFVQTVVVNRPFPRKEFPGVEQFPAADWVWSVFFEDVRLIIQQARGNHVPTDLFPFCGAKRFKRLRQRIATDAL